MKTILVIVMLLIVPEVYGASATLNWQDNSGSNNNANKDAEEGFNVQRNLNGGAFTNIAVVAANVTTYVDTTIVAPPAVTEPATPGKNTYCFQVVAFNKNPPKTGTLQTAAPSNQGCVDVLGTVNPAPVVAPAPATNLTATATDTTARKAPAAAQRKK